MAQQHERIRAALELREPDRVPTLDVMEEYANIYEVLGKKPTPLGFLVTNRYAAAVFDRVIPLLNRIGFMDSEMDRFSYDRTAAAVKLGYDGAWVMHVPIWRFRDHRITEDIYGRYYDIVVDNRGNIATPIYKGGLITSPDDWKSWDKRSILRLPERANRTYAKIQRDLGDRIAIFASFLYGIFENTWQPMGFERFAVALRKEREFIKRVIKFYEDHYCLMIEAWADAGVPGAVYSDDMAYRSGPMVNPRLMDELYGDAFRRITETAHARGMKIVVHTDGMVYPLLSWFADCGFDGVHALEPTAGVKLAEAKEMVGGRLCLLGNLDITHILVDATRDEVYEAVHSSILQAGHGGGYILAPTNSHPDMNVEHIRWMLEAVEKYGRYPLE
jgi:uroporphyrinogen decarboxylase